MTKLFLLLTLAAVVTLSSCADNKTINGTTYRPYGLVNQDQKVDSIHYEVSAWAIFSGIFFFEFIAPPIYTFGYNLWEPVCTEEEYRKNKGVAVDSDF